MRHIPHELDVETVAAIDARLDGVEAEHGVRVAWAVESGSRAWGFPSPDSDSDCRFLYLRPVEDHLTPWRVRDVIETPLDAVLDVNGWDVRKAVALLVAGNATAIEWLNSPIVYRGEEGLRELLTGLAAEVVDPGRVAWHYGSLGRRQWHHLAACAGPVKLKRFFYALRPAAALHWMHAHPGRAVVPMRLQDLLEQAPPGPAVQDAVAELIARKARTRELGVGEVPASVRDFVERRLVVEALPARIDQDVARVRAAGTRVYREAVRRFG